MTEHMIGVIGGVGSYAGVELVSKILDNTRGYSDQEHIPLLLLSLPNQISDRTEFLEGVTPINPGIELARLTKQAISSGTRVIGIPCNTAHAPEIFNHVSQNVVQHGEEVLLVNMVEEVVKELQKQSPRPQWVGVLGSTGTYNSNLYQHALEAAGRKAVVPDRTVQTNIVHEAIYAPFGIKTISNVINDRATEDIRKAARQLIDDRAQAIVQACTELSLVFPGESHFDGVPIIDSTAVMARALIHQTHPGKLRD